jgi:hypothetical protein
MHPPVLGAYYFSDVGIVNFWQSFSPVRLTEELAVFKADGFNTIFVLVPWATFQTNTSPITYDDRVLTLLDRIYDTAHDLGLNVGMRLGFLWESTQSYDRTFTRLQQIHEKSDLVEAWVDYFKTLQQRYGVRDNHAFSFLAWEDFYWPCYSPAISLTDREAIQAFLRRIGFLSHLERRFPNGYELSESGMLRDNPDIWHVFLEYWDRIIERLFRLAHNEFPGLGYEYRSDSEHLVKQHDTLFYHYHRRMFSTSCFPMTYYNQFSFKEVDLARNFRLWLNFQEQEVQEKVFISQFNFIDNTYDSSEFDNIKEFLGQRDMTSPTAQAFLDNLSTELAARTHGYALWAYRDIPNDCLFNSRFEQKLLGFDHTGEVVATQRTSGETVIEMRGESKIWQDLKHCPIGGRLKETTLRVRGVALEQSTITLGFWGNRSTCEVTPGAFCIELSNENYTARDGKEFLHCALVECARGSIVVERMAFFNIELTNLMYDRDLRARPLVQNVRSLNARLTSGSSLKR